jgi:hypothetical protein
LRIPCVANWRLRQEESKNAVMSNQVGQVAGLAFGALALVVLGVWILFHRRETPEKREQKRRLAVNMRGRLGDGIVSDVGPDVIYYSYAIGGVEYQASQDVAHLKQFLPPDPDRVIGPVTLKYAPRNPANSIVVCEDWSGLRIPRKETVSQ